MFKSKNKKKQLYSDPKLISSSQIIIWEKQDKLHQIL